MAKGGSKFAVGGLEGQEVAGEYRRTESEPRRGEGAGTGDPDEAAPLGGWRCEWCGEVDGYPRERDGLLGPPHGEVVAAVTMQAHHGQTQRAGTCRRLFQGRPRRWG